VLALLLLLVTSPAAAQPAGQQQASSIRTITIDERLAAEAGLRVGDRVVLAAEPRAGSPDAAADTVIIGGITRRGADPSEIARAEYRVRLHLDHLQTLADYGDRVDRFAVATTGPEATARALERIEASAFGFQAHRSRDIAVETSATFAVVTRFHRAIGVITIVASAIFLLCILLLKVDERRRDVAALRLMGISRNTVVGTVVLEATLVAALGSALGMAIGWVMSLIVNLYYQGVYKTPLKFAVVTPDIVLFSVALSLILGAVAGYLAALRLVRMPPLALLGR
jgi:putative ABC transport system permease protein